MNKIKNITHLILCLPLTPLAAVLIGGSIAVGKAAVHVANELYYNAYIW